MLLALLGALAVLGGGSYLVGRIQHYVDGERSQSPQTAVPEEEREAAAGEAGPVPQAGGYAVLAPPQGEASSELSGAVVTRVRNLLALGEGEEAVEIVRDSTGADRDRAREIVAGIGDGRIG